MDHIRGQIRSCKEALQMKREKKVVALCKDSGINLSTEMLQDLKTTDHHSHDLFNSIDLRQAEQQHERRRTTPTMMRTQEDEEIQVTDDGRLKGRFVSGSVVNLSRRELSEEDMSLLSKGLKFSPTPTDIDKAKLKEDLEAYNRRMRLRWHFRNNTDSDSQDATNNKSNTLRIKSTWQPPKDDPVLENYLSLLEKEVMSVSPEVRILVIFLLLNNFL